MKTLSFTSAGPSGMFFSIRLQFIEHPPPCAKPTTVHLRIPLRVLPPLLGKSRSACNSPGNAKTVSATSHRRVDHLLSPYPSRSGLVNTNGLAIPVDHDHYYSNPLPTPISENKRRDFSPSAVAWPLVFRLLPLSRHALVLSAHLRHDV